MIRIKRKRIKTIPSPSGDGKLRQFEYDKDGKLQEVEAIDLDAQINSYIASNIPAAESVPNIGSTDFDMHDFADMARAFNIEYAKLVEMVEQLKKQEEAQKAPPADEPQPKEEDKK